MRCHPGSLCPDLALDLGVVGLVGIECRAMAATEVDPELRLDLIEVGLDKLTRHSEELQCVVRPAHHSHHLRRCSRRLLKIALKTATSDVAGRLRLIV